MFVRTVNKIDVRQNGLTFPINDINILNIGVWSKAIGLYFMQAHYRGTALQAMYISHCRYNVAPHAVS
jgi:hypothetical protein